MHMTGIPLFTQPQDNTAQVMGILPSPVEQHNFEDLMKEKASDRLYPLENGLALNLEEVTVGNMVIIDHGEIDEHVVSHFLWHEWTISTMIETVKGMVK